LNTLSRINRGAGGPREQSARVYLCSDDSLVPHHSQNEVTIHELWQILRRRRLDFFFCFAAATLAALFLSLILPTRYEAVTQLTVDRESSDSFQVDALVQATGAFDAETKLQTQVNVLRTDSLAWEVIKRLRLDQRPETAHRRFIVGPYECMSGPNQSVDSITPECRRLLLDEFHERLSVQSVPKTEIIEIRYRCRSRELAAEVVNTMAETYIERNFATNYQATMRASSWLAGQLDDVKKNAELAADKYIAYQRQTGIIITDQSHNVLTERLNSVSQQLVTAEAERIVREARYRVAMANDPEALMAITPGSMLQLLHAEEVGLKNQFAQLDAKFGEAYPKVVQVKAQLEETEKATAAEITRTQDKFKTEYEAAVKSEALLQSEFERQKQEVYNTHAAATQAGLLKRAVDASSELYEQLVKKLKEAGIMAGLKATNVMVIDPAGIPVRPAEPRTALNLALGMLAGSLGGIMLCFLHENIDTRITNPNDLTDTCSLPALGFVPSRGTAIDGARIVPKSLASGVNEVITLERPESEMADAYRSLRTALLLSTAGTPPQVLLITSSVPREGKTTTSVNTAVVFAQNNRRVLLVDGDLRRADLYRCFNFPHNGGLSAALVGEDPAKFYISHPDLPSLTILPAGNRPPKPPDLLDSDRMRELIALWRQEFGQVIIDAPPLIGLSDAVILATMADTVVLVVRANQSRRHEVCRSQEILANVNANVSGAIINDFDMHRLAYYGDQAQYSHYFNGTRRRNGNSGA